MEKIETQMSLKNSEEIKLIIWGIEGQERFHSIAINELRSSQGVAVVFDFSNLDSFDNVIKWLNEIKDNLNNNICVVLFENKCDKNKEDWTLK